MKRARRPRSHCSSSLEAARQRSEAAEDVQQVHTARRPRSRQPARAGVLRRCLPRARQALGATVRTHLILNMCVMGESRRLTRLG